MDWKDLAGTVGKVAPLLGTLLTGPVGSAIAVGGMIASALGTGNSPDEVATALTNPDSLVKLKQIEADRQVKLQELATDQAKTELVSAAQVVLSVNQTMQAETVANHWPTYSWRPFIGFITGGMVLGIYFVLPLLKLPVPVVPSEVWLMLGGILGIASFFRGKMQASAEVPSDNRG